MISGIGTDIIEIGRIEKAISDTSFCARFFSKAENEYFLEKNNNPQTIAGNFAAKEAFAKALGLGFRKMALADIEVLRDSLGKPYICISGSAKKLLGDRRVHVSISHSRKYATAYVVIEEV